MKIYVAGPLTQGNQMENIRTAIAAGGLLIEDGHTPFVPHLSFFWEICAHVPYETWMKMDFDWISVCDGLLRLPGYSPGADREVEFAKSIGVPVYEHISQIPRST